MSDDEQGQPVLLIELLEEPDDVAAGLAVEVAGRLVAEQDGGAVEQRPGDGDALLLAPGELAGTAIGDEVEPDPREDLDGAGAGAVRVFGPEQRRQGDVLGAGQVVEQMKRLEDEAEPLVA